jgi:ferredoxin
MRKYRVTLRNRDGLTVEPNEDETILDAIEATGAVVPVGCRYGGCITCAARLLSGKVRQPKATALNKRQSAAGYILLCVARASEDCVIDVGVESHDQLYLNPFSVPSARNMLEKIAQKRRSA